MTPSIKKFLIIGIITLALFPAIVGAAGNLGSAVTELGKVGDIAGTKEGDIQTFVGKFINAALTLIGTIFFVLMVYAGYLWMTAHGKEEQIETARKVITAAIIGLVLVLSAYAITVFVTGRFESGGVALLRIPVAGQWLFAG